MIVNTFKIIGQRVGGRGVVSNNVRHSMTTKLVYPHSSSVSSASKITSPTRRASSTIIKKDTSPPATGRNMQEYAAKEAESATNPTPPQGRPSNADWYKYYCFKRGRRSHEEWRRRRPSSFSNFFYGAVGFGLATFLYTRDPKVKPNCLPRNKEIEDIQKDVELLKLQLARQSEEDGKQL